MARMIHASVHSDDWVHDVTFDAAPWFRQATDEEILGLARCGWGRDYEADAVALYSEGRNDRIGALMEHCRPTEDCGFECLVNEDSARVWLEDRGCFIVGHEDGGLEMVRLDSLKDEELPPLVGLDDALDRAIARRMGHGNHV